MFEGEFARRELGIEFGTEQGFRRVDVADADDGALVHNGDLERHFFAVEFLPQGGGGEGVGERFGPEVLEEVVFLDLVGGDEQDEAETARVVEGYGCVGGGEDDVVVFSIGVSAAGDGGLGSLGIGFASMFGDGEASGHPEVEHEGVIVAAGGAESGKDVFGAALESGDGSAGESLGKLPGYALAEISVADGNGGKSGTGEGGFETPAGCFDFWQFGHGSGVARLGAGA